MACGDRFTAFGRAERSWNNVGIRPIFSVELWLGILSQ